jgi:Flagellar hook-length control protein FliK
VTPGSQLDSGQTATFVLPGPSRLELANSTASAASAAPRADANATSPAPAASPVKEIDLDLSPGGLENVSMTMRLAGDRLSVVIRASSSQTLGAIEGARDAIAERMAAIGQPLSAIIIQQTDATADGTKNPNAASGEDRPGTDERHSGQRTGSRDDQSAHRRGSAGDLGF